MNGEGLMTDNPDNGRPAGGCHTGGPPECERCGCDLIFSGMGWTCMSCFPYVAVETEAVRQIREALNG